VVILGHQSQGSLCEWVSYARRLARLGYTAFAIDFRSHGRSQVLGGLPGERLASDLDGAAKLMRKRGKQKVFLVGASMGGIASLVAAANVKPAVDGVVSVSGPARFMGMNAVARAGTSNNPRATRSGSFDNLETFVFEAIVERGLFCHHRLGFHDLTHIMFARDLGDDVAHLFRCLGPVHGSTDGLRGFFKALQITA